MKTKKYNFEEESGDSDEDEYGYGYPTLDYDPYEKEHSDIVYSTAHIWKRVLKDIQQDYSSLKIDNNEYVVPLFCGMPFTSDIPNSDRRDLAKKLMLLNPGLSEETRNVIKKSLGLEKTENIDDWIKSLYSDSVMLNSSTKEGGMKGIIEISNPEAKLNSDANKLKEFIKDQYTKNDNNVKTAVKRYVDNYNQNLQEAWDWLQKTATENENKELENYTSGYPFVSTSKTPDHAVKFGFGSVCCDNKLEPEYGYYEQNKALPKKRLAGFLYVIKKSAYELLEGLKAGEAFDVFSLRGYGSDSSSMSYCDVNYKKQLEITFVGAITKGDILAIIPLTYPNFSKNFNEYYHGAALHFSKEDYSKNCTIIKTNIIHKNNKLYENDNQITLTRDLGKPNAFYAKLLNSFCKVTDSLLSKVLNTEQIVSIESSEFDFVKYDLNYDYTITSSDFTSPNHKMLRKSYSKNTPTKEIVKTHNDVAERFSNKEDTRSPSKVKQDSMSELNQNFSGLSLEEKATPTKLDFSSEKAEAECIESALTLENLFECVRSGNIESVQSLIDQGMDINSTNSSKVTALTIACEANNYDMVEFLLSKEGINFTSENILCTTPIQAAADRIAHEDGDERILKALLNKYADDKTKISNDLLIDVDIRLQHGPSYIEEAYKLYIVEILGIDNIVFSSDVNFEELSW